MFVGLPIVAIAALIFTVVFGRGAWIHQRTEVARKYVLATLVTATVFAAHLVAFRAHISKIAPMLIWALTTGGPM